MAKVQIKSEKLTPFGGIFSIMEQFDSMLSPVIDSTLGHRCRSIIGYQYSEIIRSLMSVYFCGGSCVEDVTSHLMRHLSYHPTLRTCSSDTILRGDGMTIFRLHPHYVHNDFAPLQRNHGMPRQSSCCHLLSFYPLI